MEEYLRGTDGVKRTTTDDDGNVTTEYVKEPEQGNTVVLTIDKNLQKVANDSLQNGSRSSRQRILLSPSAALRSLSTSTRARSSLPYPIRPMISPPITKIMRNYPRRKTRPYGTAP